MTFDMKDDVVKFCVSWTTINVIKSAIGKFVAAWNAQRIPGIRGGVPNVLFGRAPQTTCLATTAIPTTAEVIQLHQNQGGTLTEEHVYGTDPPEHHEHLQQVRERDFFNRYPTYHGRSVPGCPT